MSEEVKILLTCGAMIAAPTIATVVAAWLHDMKAHKRIDAAHKDIHYKLDILLNGRELQKELDARKGRV